ncbi:hypothetical protein bcgnr5379_63420 [Bacillus cereus]
MIVPMKAIDWPYEEADSGVIEVKTAGCVSIIFLSLSQLLLGGDASAEACVYARMRTRAHAAGVRPRLRSLG